MTHIGLALKPRSDSGVDYDGPHDVYLDETGNLAMATGSEAVVQHARQRCRTNRNEWFLDTEAGIPWLQDVLGNRQDTALVDALVKAEVLDTDGVETINQITVSYDRRTRGVVVEDLEVTTQYDEE